MITLSLPANFIKLHPIKSAASIFLKIDFKICIFLIYSQSCFNAQFEIQTVNGLFLRCSLCDKKTFTSMRTISIHYTKFHPAFASRTNLASHIMKVFQSTDNEEEMESENLKSNGNLRTNENLKPNENGKSKEGNISIYKGNTDIEMNRDEPESTKQIKNVKFADQSDTAIIEMNEMPKNIQEESIKIEADEYTDFHLDDLIA